MRSLAIVLLTLVLPISAQEIFEERVVVERVIVDAYVTDYQGRPIEGLDRDDFEIRIGGRRAEIEAVDWIPTEQQVIMSGEEDPVTVRQGRLLVFFFQTDFGRNKGRLSGHMKIIPRAIEFLERLHPSDLVAVVQFDTHLKIRCDFTNDRDVLADAITRSLAIDRTDPASPSTEISMLRNIDLDEARRTTSPEQALGVIARALDPIHGAKALVMFGYGLGVYTKGRVSMRHDYELARRALETSRTAVFALDITEADYHTLEIGLQQVAGDTGGFYASTYQFPSIALDRLANTLSGRYEIVLERPAIRPGRHDLHVEVNRRGTYVQVPASVVIRNFQ